MVSDGRWWPLCSTGNGSSLASELDSFTLQQRKQPKAQQTRRAKMSATLKLTRKAPVMEVVHRGTFDVLVDGKGVASVN
jgi:hypothetical protein